MVLRWGLIVCVVRCESAYVTVLECGQRIARGVVQGRGEFLGHDSVRIFQVRILSFRAIVQVYFLALGGQCTGRLLQAAHRTVLANDVEAQHKCRRSLSSVDN
ncbi:hypothetical protein PHSY_006021 [Pseudozyma hubeiensis SY62]|uniref:Uncharacterized protein n=1 Tax=Pseudozyma hubeiensis (strain SY62) TaxID=1305764 RepID=R9PB25_PSEHS|nr:hypothetical protein PHSY_006021 [Pseudozyma hubeiensis SY62]GAC98427.1 hypothetical protein PHSY_006021 [Pseudozyma hubeiensis SY62]